MTENAAPETDMPEAEAEVVLRRVATLPAAVDVRRALTARVNSTVADGREARRAALPEGHEGPVGPDRVRPLALELTSVYENLHEYAQAFEGAAKTALGHLGDEQREAMGADVADRSTKPLHLLADDDTTVTIADRVQTGWGVASLDPVFEAVAVLTLAEQSDALLAAGIDETDASVEALHALLTAAFARLVQAGKFEPQTSKVHGKTGLAAQAARVDADLATRVRESMFRTSKVTGTTVERGEA